jgi:hypothetical protein
MAKQCGSHPFTGKLSGTIGYKGKNGEHLERENGSKEGKRFRRDPKRKRTMEYARMFAQASKAVKLIYRAIPKDQQQHGVYGRLSGEAFSMIRLGSTIEEVKAVLTKQYVEDKAPLVEVRAEAAKDEGKEKTTPSAEDTPGKGALRQAQRDIKEAVSSVNEVAQNRHVIATIARPYFCSTVGG